MTRVYELQGAHAYLVAREVLQEAARDNDLSASLGVALGRHALHKPGKVILHLLGRWAVFGLKSDCCTGLRPRMQVRTRPCHCPGLRYTCLVVMGNPTNEGAQKEISTSGFRISSAAFADTAPYRVYLRRHNPMIQEAAGQHLHACA